MSLKLLPGVQLFASAIYLDVPENWTDETLQELGKVFAKFVNTERENARKAALLDTARALAPVLSLEEMARIFERTSELEEARR